MHFPELILRVADSVVFGLYCTLGSPLLSAAARKRSLTLEYFVFLKEGQKGKSTVIAYHYIVGPGMLRHVIPYLVSLYLGKDKREFP